MPEGEAVIISAGELLANSATAYKEVIDARLGEDSGLFATREKNPLREKVDFPKGASPVPQSQDPNNFMLFGKYFLRVETPEDFMVSARRYLDRDVATLEEALCLLCERDGWHPKMYPDKLIDVTERNISYFEF